MGGARRAGQKICADNLPRSIAARPASGETWGRTADPGAGRMTSVSSISLSAFVPRPAAVTLGLLAPAVLAGCGYTLEQTSRIEAREQAVTAAETRDRSL